MVSDDDGVLPDGEVAGTDRETWDRVLAALKGRGWIVPHDDSDGILVAKVSPGRGVLIIIRRYEWETIDFDFDLRELTTQPALDALCDFVSEVGQASQRDVALFAEGTNRNPDSSYVTYRHLTDTFELAR